MIGYLSGFAIFRSPIDIPQRFQVATQGNSKGFGSQASSLIALLAEAIEFVSSGNCVEIRDNLHSVSGSMLLLALCKSQKCNTPVGKRRHLDIYFRSKTGSDVYWTSFRHVIFRRIIDIV